MRNRLYLSILLIAAWLIIASCTKPVTDSTMPVDQTEFESTPTSTSTPVIVESPDGSLWIKIDYPEDGAVVATPELEIRGSASTGTVITINDDILYVETGETFSDKINLSAGANVIEIVASDAVGNEVQLFLTVYYEP